MVYTALSGLRSQMSAQATIANNIANASTTGFRADRVAFQQMMLQGGGGLASRAPAAEEVIDADRRGGHDPCRPAAPLDMAVTGTVVDRGAGDRRQRSLYPARRSEDRDSGVLETGDGFPVMGSGGPITVPPAQRVMIAEDGTLSIVPMGGAAGQAAGDRQASGWSAPKGRRPVKGLDNLLHVKGGGVLPEDMDAKVRRGLARAVERQSHPGAGRHDREPAQLRSAGQPAEGSQDHGRKLRIADAHARLT